MNKEYHQDSTFEITKQDITNKFGNKHCNQVRKKTFINTCLSELEKFINLNIDYCTVYSIKNQVVNEFGIPIEVVDKVICCADHPYYDLQIEKFIKSLNESDNLIKFISDSIEHQTNYSLLIEGFHEIFDYNFKKAKLSFNVEKLENELKVNSDIGSKKIKI